MKEENKVFKFTVEQLNYYNDSILEKMNEVRKELKIKISNMDKQDKINKVRRKIRLNLEL